MKVFRNNSKLVEIFDSMGDIYSMKKVQWKPQAYKRAARSIEMLRIDVAEAYKKHGLEGLEKISGVGESIGRKIIEFLKTGKIRTYEKLKKTIPGGLVEIMKVPGVGPKKALKLYKELGIKNINELEKAAMKGKIRKLPTFREQAEQNILEGIMRYKGHRERMPLATALREAKRILKILKKIDGVKRVSEAGSVRRREPTIGDLDLLVSSSKPEKVVKKFISLSGVKEVLAKGKTKASILLGNNLQIDIRIVADEQFGSALQYFTGSKAHNIKLRKIAMKKGMKLSEYGLFKGKKRIASRNEEDIYRALGLKMPRPEERDSEV